MSNALDLSAKQSTPPQQQTKQVDFATGVRQRIASVLQGKRGDDFVVEITALINQDQNLKTCDPISLVTSALQAQSLGLALNKILGQVYIIPFKDNKNNRTLATFQIGYKGYIQLAIRSGQYKKINVLAIKEGELEFYDPLNEEIHVTLIQDDVKRENTPTIGYYAMFEYVNGFRKAMYWSKSKMIAHADRYSQAFRKDAHTKQIKGRTHNIVSIDDYLAGNYEKRDEWLYSSFWYKDFDGMAYKTMLRQLISKWGIMSVEMQKAYENDMQTFDSNGNGDFIDADFSEQPPPQSIEETSKETEPQPEAPKLPTKAQVKKQWLDMGYTLEDAQAYLEQNYEFWKAEHVKRLLEHMEALNTQSQSTPEPTPQPEPELIFCEQLQKSIPLEQCSQCNYRQNCPSHDD